MRSAVQRGLTDVTCHTQWCPDTSVGVTCRLVQVEVAGSTPGTQVAGLGGAR